MAVTPGGRLAAEVDSRSMDADNPGKSEQSKLQNSGITEAHQRFRMPTSGLGVNSGRDANGTATAPHREDRPDTWVADGGVQIIEAVIIGTREVAVPVKNMGSEFDPQPRPVRRSTPVSTPARLGVLDGETTRTRSPATRAG